APASCCCGSSRPTRPASSATWTPPSAASGSRARWRGLRSEPIQQSLVLRFFVMSLLLAAAAAILGLRHHLDWSLIPTMGWAALLAIGLMKFRWRGLWFLVGAPAALLWPYYMLVVSLQPCGGDRWCG